MTPAVIFIHIIPILKGSTDERQHDLCPKSDHQITDEKKKNLQIKNRLQRALSEVKWFFKIRIQKKKADKKQIIASMRIN